MRPVASTRAMNRAGGRRASPASEEAPVAAPTDDDAGRRAPRPRGHLFADARGASCQGARETSSVPHVELPA